MSTGITRTGFQSQLVEPWQKDCAVPGCKETTKIECTACRFLFHVAVFRFCSYRHLMSHWKSRHKIVHYTAWGENKKCWGCKKTTEIVCNQCHFALYCRRECEKLDQKKHLQECERLRMRVEASPKSVRKLYEGQSVLHWKSLGDCKLDMSGPDLAEYLLSLMRRYGEEALDLFKDYKAKCEQVIRDHGSKERIEPRKGISEIVENQKRELEQYMEYINGKRYISLEKYPPQLKVMFQLEYTLFPLIKYQCLMLTQACLRDENYKEAGSLFDLTNSLYDILNTIWDTNFKDFKNLYGQLKESLYLSK